MNRYFLIFFSAILFWQCSKNPEFPEAEGQYVINGILQPGQPVSVGVSKTFNNPRGSGQFQQDARVMLYVDDQLQDTLEPGFDQMFHSPVVVKNGSRLRLEVFTQDGEHLTGRALIPKEINFATSVDSMAEGAKTYTYTIAVDASNPGLDRIYMKYRAFPKDTIPGDNLKEGLAVEVDQKFDEQYFGSIEGDFSGILIFKSDRKLVHAFTAMSEELYLFLLAQEKFTQSSGFADNITPVTPTNIAGGAGFFSYYQQYWSK